MLLVVWVVLLFLPGFLHGFKPLISPGSTTHRVITQQAILRKTAEVCRDIAVSTGQGFTLTIDDNLSAGDVQKACSPAGTSSSLLSTASFDVSIASMYFSNADVDTLFLLSSARHFDDEKFQEGRDIITAGMKSVADSVEQENFPTGRTTLGTICHTLQDFYSHSNWVELGNKAPFSALVRAQQPLENLADINTRTCRNCKGDNCEDNLLPDLLQRGLITSGYFSITSSEKPPGKCSHGGFFDRTSRTDPVGGINKDTVTSSHGRLHPEAADLAVLATMDLLEEMRVIVGDRKFLQLMGLSQSPALCFVIDTTGSMRDDIAEAKRVSLNIIDRRQGTAEEPSAYILVPFNDPDFGPLTLTTNAEVFKNKINSLTADGGGDTPELSLSGLQLALTAAPPSSEIFVFTDAPAKDFQLKSTVTALIESTKTVVNFMITNVLGRASRQGRAVSARASGIQLYSDLARASGGQAIQVSKSDLSLATALIEDASASAVVTVFQAVRNPGRAEEFTFTVDASLINVTVYITGSTPLTFNLTSPSGVSQTSDQASGPLASFSVAGNLRRVRIHAGNNTGSWRIGVDSVNSYSVKVTGQSSVNFIFYTVEAHEGVHGDFSLKEGRPLSGGNSSLLVTVTGSNTVKATEVTLKDSSGQTEIKGTLQSLGGGTFLVTFSDVNSGEYAVHLRGEDTSSASRSTSSVFQRQASTQIRTSGISLTAQADVTSIEPGGGVSVAFTVTTNGTGATLTVKSTNDRGYPLSPPGSINVIAGSGGAANGTVNMTVPAGATSGTDVTLTIEAQNAAGTDVNYAVLRFLVAARATDVTPPVCHLVSLSDVVCDSSSAACASARWELVANLTDGINGTGIRRVSVRQGNGTLNSSSVVGERGENITVVTYNALCCSDSVELAVVDRAGNVGSCVGQAKQISTTTVTPGTPTTPVAPTTPVTPGGVSSSGHDQRGRDWSWITVLGSFLLAVK